MRRSTRCCVSFRQPEVQNHDLVFGVYLDIRIARANPATSAAHNATPTAVTRKTYRTSSCSRNPDAGAKPSIRRAQMKPLRVLSTGVLLISPQTPNESSLFRSRMWKKVNLQGATRNPKVCKAAPALLSFGIRNATQNRHISLCGYIEHGRGSRGRGHHQNRTAATCERKGSRKASVRAVCLDTWVLQGTQWPLCVGSRQVDDSATRGSRLGGSTLEHPARRGVYLCARLLAVRISA